MTSGMGGGSFLRAGLAASASAAPQSPWFVFWVPYTEAHPPVPVAIAAPTAKGVPATGHGAGRPTCVYSQVGRGYVHKAALGFAQTL